MIHRINWFLSLEKSIKNTYKNCEMKNMPGGGDDDNSGGIKSFNNIIIRFFSFVSLQWLQFQQRF